MSARIHICADPAALAEAAAARWIDLARAAREERGVFHVALSGGSTPSRFYRRLATLADRLEWSSIHLWFGDERAVPLDHKESNYRLVCETLIDTLKLESSRIHPMNAAPETLEEDAMTYARSLCQLVPQGGLPRLDLVLLGLGADGHIASLFPGTEAVEEQARLVVPVRPPPPQWPRLSLTLPVLNASRHRMILVSGQSKATILRRALKGGPEELPIDRLRQDETTEWFLDADAATSLPGTST